LATATSQRWTEKTVHPRTVAALEELEKASWFSRVGIDEGFGTAVVATWPEAMDCCDSSAWDDLQLGALNQDCASHHRACDQIKPERQQAEEEDEPEGLRSQPQPQDLAEPHADAGHRQGADRG
jgi:hypothetical protein